MNHTAFHSSVYMLAFDAVTDEHKESTWSYIKSRIDPPFSTSSPSAAPSAATRSSHQLWPPPPPIGEHVRALTAFMARCAARILA